MRFTAVRFVYRSSQCPSENVDVEQQLFLLELVRHCLECSEELLLVHMQLLLSVQSLV
jgi:hypothetical protein